MRVEYIKFGDILLEFVDAEDSELIEELSVFKDFYLRVDYLSKKKVHYSFYEKNDGTGEELPFFCEFQFGKNKVRLDSVDNFFASEKVFADFQNIAELAKENNKTLLGFAYSRHKHRYWYVNCNTCGTDSALRQHLFHRCNVCYKKKLENLGLDFCRRGREKHDDKYGYDRAEYKNAREKVEIYCKKCNIYFWQRPCDHIYGAGCPKCCESKGERAVRKHLNKLGIEHESQMTFPGLVHINELKYDFYFIYNGKRMLIEYDGEHHSRPVVYNGDIEKAIRDFEELKIRDKKKNEYALLNDISLLRIPYWDMKKIPLLIDAFILENVKVTEVRQLVLEM